MSEDHKDHDVEVTDAKQPEDTTSEKSEKQEQSIPHSRFKEVNDRKKELEEKLRQIQEDQEKSERQKKEEQGQYKELLEEAKQKEAELLKKAQLADEAMETISSMNEQMIQELPEELRTVAESAKGNMTPTAYNRWLIENRPSMMKAANKPNLGTNIPEKEEKTYTMDELRRMWGGSEEESRKADEIYSQGNYTQ